MVPSDSLGVRPAEGSGPDGKAWRRILKRAGGFFGGVGSAGLAIFIGTVSAQAINARLSTPDILVIKPERGSHAKAAPCLEVSGHGHVPSDKRLVLATQEISPKGARMHFTAVVQTVGGEWDAIVRLTGTEGNWFRVRALLVDSEWVGYLPSVTGTAGASTWTSPAVPPGAVMADSVDVQRGPGQIFC